MRQMCSLDAALREGRESDVLTLMSRGSIINVVSYESSHTYMYAGVDAKFRMV